MSISALLKFVLLLALPSHVLAAEPAAECQSDSVRAFAGGEALLALIPNEDLQLDESPELCADFCVPVRALNFLSRAQLGNCIDQGLTNVIRSRDIQISGTSFLLFVTIYGPEAPSDLPTLGCEEGSTSAFASGRNASAFGADGAEFCAQFCVPVGVLQFLPNAEHGTCADQGYSPEVLGSREVDIPGSLNPLLVSIYGPETPAAGHPPVECDAGSISAVASGQAAREFGVDRSDLCAQFCLQNETALASLPNAQNGTCTEQGYTSVVVTVSREIQIPGSSMALNITIYSSATITVGSSNETDFMEEDEVLEEDGDDEEEGETGPSLEKETEAAAEALVEKKAGTAATKETTLWLPPEEEEEDTWVSEGEALQVNSVVVLGVLLVAVFLP